MCVCVCVCARPRACAFVCTHAYIRTYVRTYVHTYIQTNIHTYIHTNNPSSRSPNSVFAYNMFPAPRSTIAQQRAHEKEKNGRCVEHYRKHSGDDNGEQNGEHGVESTFEGAKEINTESAIGEHYSII